MSTRKLLPHGADRPLASIVALDPAYAGPGGLAVVALRAPEDGLDPAPAVWSGLVRSVECFRWLGEAVAAVTPRGTRTLLVCESDAFRSLVVARKLGIAVGAVEGLLLDLNALVPGSRVDVPSGTWRQVLTGRKVRDRTALKAAAIRHAAKRWGLKGLGPDASEALCILEWALRAHTYGEVLE